MTYNIVHWSKKGTVIDGGLIPNLIPAFVTNGESGNKAEMLGVRLGSGPMRKKRLQSSQRITPFCTGNQLATAPTNGSVIIWDITKSTKSKICKIRCCSSCE